MRNKPITVTLFTDAYDDKLKINPHSKLKEGIYSVGNGRVSLLTKKGEELVLSLNVQYIDSIATLNQSAVQIKDHNVMEVENKIYAFSKKSNNKGYWGTLTKII